MKAFALLLLLPLFGCVSKVEIVALKHEATAAKYRALDKIPDDMRIDYLQANRSEYDFQEGRFSAFNELLDQ